MKAPTHMFNAPDARSRANAESPDRWDCHLGALFVSTLIAVIMILCFVCQLIAIALALGAIIAPGFV